VVAAPPGAAEVDRVRRPRTAGDAAPPATATQRVYDGIWTAILEHRLAPGSRLREEELAESFAVSRTVVRQALNRLAQDQVIELRHNVGAQVPQPSRETAAHVFDARRVVECEVARRLAGQLDAAQWQQLQRVGEHRWPTSCGARAGAASASSSGRGPERSARRAGWAWPRSRRCCGEGRWILRKLHEQQERAHRQAARVSGATAAIPFLGETVILVLDPRATGAVLHSGADALPGVPHLTLHLGLPQQAGAEQIRDVVQSWLQRQARRVFEERCALFAARLGVRMRRCR
jgi:DNA-binding transcriptional regulator YhcF (GntR family)